MEQVSATNVPTVDDACIGLQCSSFSDESPKESPSMLGEAWVLWALPTILCLSNPQQHPCSGSNEVAILCPCSLPKLILTPLPQEIKHHLHYRSVLELGQKDIFQKLLLLPTLQYPKNLALTSNISYVHLNDNNLHLSVHTSMIPKSTVAHNFSQFSRMYR